MKNAFFGAVSLLLIVLVVLVFILESCFGIFGGTARVARKNFSPEAAVMRYEWFKDAAANLDAQNQNISNYEARLDALRASYEGMTRQDWDRFDKETERQWMAELVGLQGAYNKLAAEYNSNMSKINFRYANVGEVPAGGEALPREYRTYQ